MPKLAAKDRKKVGKAEANNGGFEPISPGKYVATLSAVEAKNSANGNAMWVAEFSDITSLDGTAQPGRQWMNIMLPIDTMPDDYGNDKGWSDSQKEEKWEQYQSLTAGRIKAFFEAFGYEVDSDTDEMIGDKAIIQIGIRTIQKGERAGQKANQVNGIFPLGDVDVESGDGGKSEDDF